MIDRTPVNDEILREHMIILFRNAPTIYITTLLNCLFVFYILKGHIDNNYLLLWICALLLLVLLRVFVTNQFWKQANSPARSLFCYYFYIILMHCSAITWGLLVYLPLTYEFTWTHAFISFVIAGMSAGAMLSLSVTLLASIPYLVLILIPFAWFFLSVNTEAHSALGIMTILYFLLLTRLAYQVNSTIRDSIVIKMQNEELYDFLKKTSRQSFMQFLEKFDQKTNGRK